tara:strand:- start:53 stop:553 length:501 start_codon:yes stop_codon:yes gene_type:complete
MSKPNTYDSMKTPDLSSQDKKAMKSLDSQWLETKAHRDHWEGVVKRYKKNRSPDFLIVGAERIAKLTHWEYRLECKEAYRLWEEERDEYVRGNPMKESVVEELYSRFDKIMDEFCEESDSILCYGSGIRWSMALDPLSIMSRDDWTFVYTPLIDSLHDQFLKKHGK